MKQVRVLKFDDKKILTRYIIAVFSRTDATSWPTVFAAVSHLAYRRRTGPADVQVKFKQITEQFIKGIDTKWYY